MSVPVRTAVPFANERSARRYAPIKFNKSGSSRREAGRRHGREALARGVAFHAILQVRFAGAEGESVDGFVKQCSVVVNPRRLKAFDLALDTVRNATPMQTGRGAGPIQAKLFLTHTYVAKNARFCFETTSDAENIVAEHAMLGSAYVRIFC